LEGKNKQLRHDVKYLEDLGVLLEDKNTQLLHDVKNLEDLGTRASTAYSELQAEKREWKKDIAKLSDELARMTAERDAHIEWLTMGAHMGAHTQLRCLLAQLA